MKDGTLQLVLPYYFSSRRFQYTLILCWIFCTLIFMCSIRPLPKMTFEEFKLSYPVYCGLHSLTHHAVYHLPVNVRLQIIFSLSNHCIHMLWVIWLSFIFSKDPSHAIPWYKIILSAKLSFHFFEIISWWKQDVFQLHLLSFSLFVQF